MQESTLLEVKSDHKWRIPKSCSIGPQQLSKAMISIRTQRPEGCNRVPIKWQCIPTNGEWPGWQTRLLQPAPAPWSHSARGRVRACVCVWLYMRATYHCQVHVYILESTLRPSNMQCVSRRQICLVSCTCPHIEKEAADQTCHLTQSQCTGTGPTSPGADPVTPGTWQGSH